ncbi:MAG TPA: class I SAM-dependent methyltransferase [Hyphomicrobiales bacterium]|nr:class I SAM-dependent methyltransferase [Hyphomicrobiales bacterium]
MTSFSADWLALREPYDAAARSAALIHELTARICHKSTITFADLGCGTGANLRYVALALPPDMRQRWRLIDNDRELLSAARAKLLLWADRLEEKSEGALLIEKNARKIEVTFAEADLAANIETILEPGEIATASAFFDLASPSWIERFVRSAANIGAVIYAPLIYNGAEARLPAHPADGAMLAAFRLHQRRDKGFGPAAGPAACSLLKAFLGAEGYAVFKADSSWHLGESDGPIIAALAETCAAAVRELSLFDEASILSWSGSRKCPHSYTVGHIDILAIPSTD